MGELGTGHAFSDFQAWLKELKNRGMLLAVCSKNSDRTAKEPFEKHPEMILRLEDFSMFVANWEDKASNIRAIQKTLNIGMDSLVFLDDNPFERNLVRSMIPEITVPELPEENHRTGWPPRHCVFPCFPLLAYFFLLAAALEKPPYQSAVAFGASVTEICLWALTPIWNCWRDGRSLRMSGWWMESFWKRLLPWMKRSYPET